MNVRDTALLARAAAPSLAAATAEKKNSVILGIAAALRNEARKITEANALDLRAAEKAGMRKALIDRLRLTEEIIEGMAGGAAEVAALEDPAGQLLGKNTNADGLVIEKVSVPFGLIGIIFEARPNVAVDSALLCIKSGNAVLLRGGSEAINSNRVLVGIMRGVLRANGLDENAVSLVDDVTRQSATDMMELTGVLDLLIPRGGKGLIAAVVQNSLVPVIETGTGNCHVYIDAAADFEMAKNIIYNAKTSRPSVCNAAETLLVCRSVAKEMLPDIADMLSLAGVELRGDEEARRIVPSMKAASEEDFYTEYNDYILTVGIVENVDEAIAHINKYGTKHSESIVTNDAATAKKFLDGVDAAAVYHNASTRFTDGFVFGLGAEIGISTQKLHARGPMGLRELTTYKYRIYGSGQIR